MIDAGFSVRQFMYQALNAFKTVLTKLHTFMIS